MGKIIDFQGANTNCFHSAEEFELNRHPSLGVVRGRAIVIGCTPDKVKEGDILKVINNKGLTHYTVVGEVTRSDSKGVYNNPGDEKDRKFECECKFERNLAT